MKQYHLTKEGYENLLKELDDLVENKRKEIAARLKEAKDFGELSENPEYDYAKKEQAFVEGRIEQINEILQNYIILNENNSVQRAFLETAPLLPSMFDNAGTAKGLISRNIAYSSFPDRISFAQNAARAEIELIESFGIPKASRI